MPDDTPLVHYKPGCPCAARPRAQLTVARVPPRSVRFRDDEDGAGAVRARSREGIRALADGGAGPEYLTDPSLRQVREAVSRS